MRSLHPSEAQIQAAIVDWLRRVMRCEVFHIPNGGARDKREAAKLKWQGVQAGVSDLCVLWNEQGEPRACFIEVKTAKGRLSESQIEWRERVKALGHDYIVARSLDDVRLFFCGE